MTTIRWFRACARRRRRWHHNRPAPPSRNRKQSYLQYRVDLGGLALIALDTVVADAPHGELDAGRLDWLQAHLDTTTPTVIAMHHPPFATGIAHMDTMGLLRGATELESMLRHHHNIERIVCGHLHRSIQTRFANTLACTCPSPAHQLTLELRPDGPASYRMEPPGYLLHLWRDGRLVTHSGVLGAFPGPQHF